MPSHLNLFLAVAEALARRGHRVTFFNLPENREAIQRAGFAFVSMAPRHISEESLGAMMRQLGKLNLIDGLRLHKRFDELRYEAILQHGPSLASEAKIDALVVDQADASAGTVGDANRLPWVTIASGLWVGFNPAVPPVFTPWPESRSHRSGLRNRLIYTVIGAATASTQKLLNRYRAQWKLPPLHSFDDSCSPFAQISQLIPELDLPRNLPPCFHYVGPIQKATRQPIPFPFEQLTGKPLVYASLGTINAHRHVHEAILRSCEDLPVQLVLSLGGAADVRDYGNIPANALLVRYAPQLELLKRASLTITHGGLNTVLESLSAGVPALATPINFDQPGVAARLKRSGAGDFIPAAGLTAQKLRPIVERLLQQPEYRESARRISEKLKQTNGADSAAQIIEGVIASKAEHNQVKYA